MLEKYTTVALALANLQPGPGGRPWSLKHIEGCEMTSDACSGGLSWFYAIMGRKISCHDICVLHDFLYGIGGDEMAREFADVLLKYGAAHSGKFVGWRAPFRRCWRKFRASKIIYPAVRVFGKNHWG